MTKSTRPKSPVRPRKKHPSKHETKSKRRAESGDTSPSLSSSGVESFTVSESTSAARESKAVAIEDILQSDFHLTKGNYLYPLVENYIAKYNAEYGEADRQRRQEETMRNRRKTLELLGVAVRDQQEILQLASVAPMVLDTALKETWGNKRIKSPTRFILSRMRLAVSA